MWRKPLSNEGPHKSFSVRVTLSSLHQRWNPSNQLISQRRSCWGWSSTTMWFRSSSLMRRTSEGNSTTCTCATNRWITSSWCCRYLPRPVRRLTGASVDHHVKKTDPLTMFLSFRVESRWSSVKRRWSLRTERFLILGCLPSCQQVRINKRACCVWILTSKPSSLHPLCNHELLP